MAHIRRLLQTRPNTDTNFFVPGGEIINLINEYKGLGKILEYKSENSNDNLTNIISIKFNTVDDWNEFLSNEISVNSGMNRWNHCHSNSISWSVENVEDNS